jgi:sorbitol/mannitol transport system permease protein
VLGRALLTPAVALLFIWMIVPLVMTDYFSTLHYSLLDSETWSFVGLENFRYFLTDPAFLTALQNTPLETIMDRRCALQVGSLEYCL